MIRAGRLSVRVEIQKPVVTTGATREYVKDWDTVATRRIELENAPNANGREIFFADYQERAINRYRTRLRWERKLKDLDATWRFVQCDNADRVYELQAVDNVLQRNREFIVTAEITQ